MADNLSISTAEGTIEVETKETSTNVHLQRTLNTFLLAGARTDVTLPGAGTAGPMPVAAYLSTDYIVAAGLGIAPAFASISISATATTAIKAAEATKKIRLLSLVFSKVDAGSIQLLSAATAKTGTMEILADSPFILPFNPMGWLETAVAEALNLTLATGTLTGGGCFSYALI